MVPLARTGHDHAAIEHRLRSIERGLVDERIEVAARGHAVVRALDLPDVDRVPHHLAEALWRQLQALRGCAGPPSVARAITSCFVYRPVARSSNACRTSGPRSGSCTRLALDHFGALR